MSHQLKALVAVIAAIFAWIAFTGSIVFKSTRVVDGTGMRPADFRVSLRPRSIPLVNGMEGALAVDGNLAPEKNAVCIDRYRALQGAYTMLELLSNLDTIHRNVPLEIQGLRRGRYFFAALLHDNEEVFGFWQRELFKVILLLGNERFDNIYVSIYESGSSDMTKVCLVGLRRMLTALKIPHRILTEERLDGMARVKRSALLRNLSLEPLFNAVEEYDQVVYLKGMYFCSSDVIDLVRVVQDKDADMTCSVDYVAREPGVQVQDSIRLHDRWVAHDIKGQSFVKDWPYMCDTESQSKFDVFQPVRVFSCWNGMVAIQGDIFQKLRIRFRAAHQFECKSSECDIVVRDMWAMGRDRIVMVPTARTAYDFKVFDALLERDNPGLGRTYDLNLGAIPPPRQATCCPLNDLFYLVHFEDCFSDENWKLPYDIFGVALAPNNSAVSATISVPPDVASLSTHLTKSQPADEEKECLALSKASKIPIRIVHFAGDAGPIYDNRKDKLAMAQLSWMARHPCFTYDLIDDDRLEAIATQRFEADISQLDFVPNVGIRIDYIRLLYIYENGGLYVPANSWALESLTSKVLPTDSFVLGMATDPQNNSTYLGFLAAERHSPLIKEVMSGAMRLLNEPMELAELVRGDSCSGSADRRERCHITGMGMLLRTIKKHESEGARLVNYNSKIIQGYVGEPEHICSDMVKIEKDYGGTPPRGPFALRTHGTDSAGNIERDSNVGLIRSLSFSVLRVNRALFQGQYLPTFFGDLHGVEPSWTTPPITDAELAAASLSEPPEAVFAYMSEAGELGIYAGLGPLDKSMRLIRTVAKARIESKAEDCSMVNVVLQDDSDLVLYCERVDERGRAKLSVLWTAGSSLAPEFRGPKHSFVMLRRDGRLALYPGIHPDSWGYDVPQGPSWKAALKSS